MFEVHKAELPMGHAPFGDRIADAKSAAAELKDALQGKGIVLPSLAVDWVSAADTTRGPLLDLGRCTIETARKLLAAVQGDTE